MRYPAEIAILAVVALPGSTQVDAAKVRALMRLPSIQIEFRISLTQFTTVAGSAMERKAIKAGIEKLKEEIQRTPGDPERWLRIGSLYARLKDQKDASSAYGIALAALDKPAAPVDQSSKAARLVQRGRALEGLTNMEAAEKAFRAAVEVDPKSAEAFRGLAGAQAGRAWAVLCKNALEIARSGDEEDTVQRLSQALAADRPTAERIALAQKLMNEADKSYKRAIECAPSQAAALQEYLAFRIFQQPLLSIIASTTSANGDYGRAIAETLARTTEDMLRPENAADIRRCAELAPNSAQAAGWAAFVEIMPALKANPSESTDVLAGMPADSRERTRRYLAALERISARQDLDDPVAPRLSLAMLRFMANDYPGAELALKTALDADPERTQTYELMTGLYVQRGKFQELTALCERRVQYEDNARTRLILAKAYERQGRLDRMEEQVRRALDGSPDDFTANVALAIALVKRGAEPSAPEAEKALDKAAELYGAAKTPDNWRNLTMAGAFFQALGGDLPGARDSLKQVLEHFPDDETAKSLRDLIGE